MTASRLHRAAVILPLLALGATGLAGCGGSSKGGASASTSASTSASASPTATSANEQTKPAATVLSDAQAALVAAKAVHLTGSLNETLESGQTQAVQLDLQLQGNDTAGSVTEGAVTLNLVVVGGKAYIKTSAQGLQGAGLTAAQAAKVANRWLALTSIPAIAAQFTQANLASGLGSSKTPLLPAVTPTTYEGQQAVSVGRQGGGTLIVRNTGAPVPLALNGNNEGRIAFSGYDQVQPLTAPPDAVSPEQAAAG